MLLKNGNNNYYYMFMMTLSIAIVVTKDQSKSEIFKSCNKNYKCKILNN